MSISDTYAEKLILFLVRNGKSAAMSDDFALKKPFFESEVLRSLILVLGEDIMMHGIFPLSFVVSFRLELEPNYLLGICLKLVSFVSDIQHLIMN